MPDASVPASQGLVLIGGQIAAGKSAAARGLAARGGAVLVEVRRALEEILGGSGWDRRRLQIEGADLDRRTQGTWLLDYVIAASEQATRLVVDAARTRRQTEPLLEAGIGARLVFLAASESTRRQRYQWAQEHDAVKRSTSFDEAMSHATETEARTLRAMAEFVIETDDLSIDHVVNECCSLLGW